LAISPDGVLRCYTVGGWVASLIFLVFSNKLLTTGIATIAIHSAQFVKPLATVHTSDTVTVLFRRGIGFFTFRAHIFAGTGYFWFIFTSWFWPIIPRFLFKNSSPSLSPFFNLGGGARQSFDVMIVTDYFRFESFPEEFQVLEKFFEGFYVVCLHLHSRHMRLIRGFLAQHACLKSKGHSWLGLVGKSVFPTEVVWLHRKSVLETWKIHFTR
jgi:hypothetical protein